MRKQVSELQHGDDVRGLGVVQSTLPANPGRHVQILRPAKLVSYQWNEDAFVEVNLPEARGTDQIEASSAPGLYLILDGSGRAPKHGGTRYHKTFDEALIEARNLVLAYPDECANITIHKQVSVVWAEQ